MQPVAFHPCIVGLRSMPWRESVALAAAVGYDAVDLDLAALASDGDRAPAQTLSEAGLRPGAAMLPVEFRHDDERFERDLAELPALASLAAAAGVQTLTRSLPASSVTPAGELRPVLVERLQACAGIASEHGLRIAIEGVSPLHLRVANAHPFIWRLVDVLGFAQACGDHVGVLVDAWHWQHAGDSLADIEQAADRIFAVHIADASSAAPADIRDTERLIPGEGVIDLASWAGALRAADWRGPVTPEVFNDALAQQEPPEQRARSVLDATRRALGAVR